ncbi:hypothetical protein AVEN_6818-1 [Araneus ventricosus]|uniref:CRAL-TRIO domain-containing protein n=1 Tax=Araneus ventricosus TaxID=182803 RepID=A0A4Y2I749_ARAVE|nr:hypothetical protein AVEN_6818-1 [Araneus ventricosus]
MGNLPLTKYRIRTQGNIFPARIKALHIVNAPSFLQTVYKIAYPFLSKKMQERGYIKQRVYATPPPTLQELRNRITDACASMSPAMLYNVQREVQSRVQMCIVAEGHHFEQRESHFRQLLFS